MDNVDCISATLNYLDDRDANDDESIDDEFKSIAPYKGLNWSFPFNNTEEGYKHWIKLSSQLEKY